MFEQGIGFQEGQHFRIVNMLQVGEKYTWENRGLLFSSFQAGETKYARQTAHECLYGLGTSCQKKVRRPISKSTQCRIEQNTRKTMEVSHCKTHIISVEDSE